MGRSRQEDAFRVSIGSQDFSRVAGTAGPSTTSAQNANAMEPLDTILQGLMRRYRERVPDVDRVLSCLLRDGLISSPDAIENDHIAFRTMGLDPLGIQSLEKIFLHCGYQRRDAYYFSAKRLNAFWYSPPSPAYPRVFISELRVADLPEATQQLIRSYTANVARDPIDSLDLDDGASVDAFLHQSLWRTPSWHDYQELTAASEYAGWVIYNRYYLNHFTLSVHNLPAGFDTINQFNDYLEQNGFQLNDSGGKAKISSDGLLIQSSTVAKMMRADFPDGKGGTESHPIPGSYVEFAERRVLPEFQHLPPGQIQRQHRRDGFETANADRIFESTYQNQTRRTSSNEGTAN